MMLDLLLANIDGSDTFQRSAEQSSHSSHIGAGIQKLRKRLEIRLARLPAGDAMRELQIFGAPAVARADADDNQADRK